LPLRSLRAAAAAAAAGTGAESHEGNGRTCLLTSAYVSIRQNASACVSIRQHTSAYVSMRQHTSACVSIRQQPIESRRQWKKMPLSRQTSGSIKATR
jgi:hypothetical protein